MTDDQLVRAAADGDPDAFAAMVHLLPRGSVVASLPQPRAAATAANRHLEVAVAAGRLRLVDMRASGPASWRGKVAATDLRSATVGMVYIPWRCPYG